MEVTIIRVYKLSINYYELIFQRHAKNTVTNDSILRDATFHFLKSMPPLPHYCITLFPVYTLLFFIFL